VRTVSSVSRRGDWDLNTGVSGVDDEGKWDEDAHKALIAPIYTRIMGHDGVAKCYIGRWNVQVDYMPNILTADQAFEIAHEAVAWGAEHVEGLFPDRGDKQPELVGVRKDPPRPPDSLLITWNSSLTAFVPKRGNVNDMDLKKVNARRYGLTRRLAATDGVCDITMFDNGVRIHIRLGLTTLNAVQAHVLSVLQATKPGNGVKPPKWARHLFPYIDSFADLALNFKFYVR